MLNRIITWSLENRLLVLVLAALVAVIGGYSALHLPLDAFPDTTPVQVQINATAPALSPLEIEQQVTFPIEQVIGGLPGLVEVRSISKMGLSQVTAVFSDDTSIYLARQQVMERLAEVELPESAAPPQMGPISTGLGEIFHYLITSSSHTLTELTTLHDWFIRPRLLSVPGVAEVNTWGGMPREFHVEVDPARLLAFDLTLADLRDALSENNLSVGGGAIVEAGEMQLVRGLALTQSIPQLEGIVVASRQGVPVHVRDVATVVEGRPIRRGAATAEGKGEVVLGLGFMLMGENSHDVAARLSQRLAEIAGDLPPGVEARPVYVRTELVDQVLHTVRENLQYGALLVVAVLFIFMGNLRAGLIVAAAIPLSMLFAAGAMLRAGIAGSLMSLGAIDFGLVVDSSVIMVENSVRRLREKGAGGVLETVREAALEVRKPTMFGELIIMIVYLPILTLEGVEGKLFRPMAWTVVFALLGSLVFSLTLMPVLSSLVLGRGRRTHRNLLIAALERLYRPVVRAALSTRYALITLAVALLCAGGWLASRLGSEFIPRLSEMSIVINTVRLAGIDLDENVRYGTRLEKILLAEFPDEIRDLWTRTGTPQVATDPMGTELSDVFIMLHPRRQWTRARTQDELTAEMREVVAQLPGMRAIFTQPIEMRLAEMTAGIRTDVGVKMFGDDLDMLRALAEEVEAVLRTIPGAAEVYTEQTTGQPMLEVEIESDAISRHGVTAAEAHTLGRRRPRVVEVRADQRRFPLVVRLDEATRDSVAAFSRLVIPTKSGERLPLASLARIRQTEGPSTITREWQKRRVLVQCDVEGRDVGSFVNEARRRLREEVRLPEGYHVEFGGQFENLERARARLAVIVPTALAMILFLLYLSVGSWRDALLIFTGAPFAALGGILALWLRDMPFTISAGVGVVAVSGVATLNGLVLVSTLQRMLADGLPLFSAIEESAVRRLRPILMTALVAGLGFVPMMLNTGVGAEVQRPLATVVVAGVITDNLLTLLVLPALYAVFGSRVRTAHQTNPA
ncbi:efflux RND transporter permease subunit [bacterium]|nr:efflux RND transporter permease subunit [bacterium]